MTTIAFDGSTIAADTMNQDGHGLKDYASKLIPLTQQIRDGILYMAGGNGGKSRREVMEAIELGETKDRTKGITDRYDADLSRLEEEYQKTRDQI